MKKNSGKKSRATVPLTCKGATFLQYPSRICKLKNEQKETYSFKN
jgi:hypothetical protein